MAFTQARLIGGQGDSFVEHKQSVTDRKDGPVGELFFLEANYCVNNMKVTVLSETYSLEMKYSDRSLNNGMNDKTRIIQFLQFHYFPVKLDVPSQ